jgi:cytidylate kinase
VPQVLVRVAVSGPPGSGKTTQAKRIAEYYGLKYFSAGEIFREYARSRGLSLEELSLLAVKDPRIDLEIDRRTMEVAKEDNIVLDGHLSAWIVSDMMDVKILVTAPVSLRILRIAGRDNIPLEKAYRETIIRENAQRKRFMEFYGIDLDDLSIFDVVINTRIIGVDEAFQIIRTVIDKVLKGDRG